MTNINKQPRCGVWKFPNHFVALEAQLKVYMLRSLLQGLPRNYSNWSLYLCMNAPLGEPGGRALQSVQTAVVSFGNGRPSPI